MKMEIKITGCPYEDRQDLAIFSHAQDMQYAISEARNMIRQHLKNNDVSDAEWEFLMRLQDELFVEGIDW